MKYLGKLDIYGLARHTDLSEHEADGVPRDPALGVEVVEVVHDELGGGRKVGLVELVGNVPAEWPELAPLLQANPDLETRGRYYKMAKSYFTML